MTDNPFEPPAPAVDMAIAAARRSPCDKSKRGVAVMLASGTVVATGCNGLPGAGVCTADAACRLACSRRCVHAEVRAVRAALASSWRGHALGTLLPGMEAVHVKVNAAGELVAGGGPSCAECAREVLDVGLAWFWLYEAHAATPSPFPAWRRYSVVEFHRLSLLAAGLVPMER